MMKLKWFEWHQEIQDLFTQEQKNQCVGFSTQRPGQNDSVVTFRFEDGSTTQVHRKDGKWQIFVRVTPGEGSEIRNVD